jgi:hypothetical protein
MRTEAKMIEMAKISLMRLHLIISPKHKRTEGRAPVWGSEYKSRYITGGDSSEFAPGLKRKIVLLVRGGWCVVVPASPPPLGPLFDFL